ncbi:hypothetical protein PGT21_027091 [Puccinia graminis f. sp. tritici]|uniref:Uncharacterized protein n=1 Tax=Puccinia graminis f. sp. tritici TaxID=56615 RepID=A0A5B0NP25_PUCGR|nr:hypothetical protein PGT21_027091 [Puccinia graminis f. sp. tritici]
MSVANLTQVPPYWRGASTLPQGMSCIWLEAEFPLNLLELHSARSSLPLARSSLPLSPPLRSLFPSAPIFLRSLLPLLSLSALFFPAPLLLSFSRSSLSLKKPNLNHNSNNLIKHIKTRLILPRPRLAPLLSAAHFPLLLINRYHSSQSSTTCCPALNNSPPTFYN